MTSKFALSFVALSLLILGASAQAARPAPKATALTFDMAVGDEYKPVSDGEYQKMMTDAAKRGKRSVAADAAAEEELTFDAKISDELENLQKTLQTKVKHGSDIDPLLDELEANYNNFKNNDMKLAAALLIPLRAMKSFFYKMIPVAKNAKVTHAMLITFAQQVAMTQKIYLPTAQWTAGFEYISQPWHAREADAQHKCKSKAPYDQYNYYNDLRSDAWYVAYCEISRAAERVKKLDLTTPVPWDGQIFYGIANKNQQDFDRYRKVGEAEKDILLAAMNSTMQALCAFAAYQAPDFFKIAQRMGEIYGLYALPFADVQGAPAEARANVLASYKGKDFILDPANGKSLMQRGFGHLQEAVRYANAAWAEVKEKPAKSWQIADPSMFTPFGVNRGISASLKTMNEMLAGPTTLHSIVTTHETITVDLKKLLNDDPPPSLLDFLPTHFATSPTDAGPKKDGMITKKDYPNEYRNYLYRSPTDWNLDAYAKYFPDIRSVGPNNADNAGRVNTAARIIAQSWGGMIFGPAAPILQ